MLAMFLIIGLYQDPELSCIVEPDREALGADYTKTSEFYNSGYCIEYRKLTDS